MDCPHRHITRDTIHSILYVLHFYLSRSIGHYTILFENTKEAGIRTI